MLEFMEALSKDGKYRQRHPERVKESAKRHYATHREEYAIKRRERYQLQRAEILERLKNDRVECPFCSNITFNRQYLPKHIKTRHKMDPTTVITTEFCRRSSSQSPRDDGASRDAVCTDAAAPDHRAD